MSFLKIYPEAPYAITAVPLFCRFVNTKSLRHKEKSGSGKRFVTRKRRKQSPTGYNLVGQKLKPTEDDRYRSSVHHEQQSAHRTLFLFGIGKEGSPIHFGNITYRTERKLRLGFFFRCGRGAWTCGRRTSGI